VFNFTLEKELQDFIISNFNRYFSFSYVCQELTVECGRIDLIGEDEDNVYIIELKRDIITKTAVKQLDNYMDYYKTTKNIIGIATAPEISDGIDLSLFKNNIRLQCIDGVHCLFDHNADSLKNRERIGTSLPIELVKKMKDYSESTMIPISKIIEKAIDEYLKSVNK